MRASRERVDIGSLRSGRVGVGETMSAHPRRKTKKLTLAVGAVHVALAATVLAPVNAQGGEVTDGNGDTAYAWNWLGTVNNDFMNSDNWDLGYDFPGAPALGDLDICLGPIAVWVDGSFSNWQLPVNFYPVLSQSFTSPYLILVSYNQANSLTLSAGTNYAVSETATVGCSHLAASSPSELYPPDEPVLVPAIQYPLSGIAASLILTDGATLTCGGDLNIGYDTTGNFNQTGGTNAVAGTLYLGNNAGGAGTYNLGGTGSLSVGGYEQVGYSGAGTFTQTGGSNFIGGVALGIGANSGSTGAYTLENGTLTAANSETVGYAGQGQFNQSGGTNSINTGAAVLWIGQLASGVGNYSLSNGSLSVGNGNENIGGSGTGTFTQTGGTNTVTGSLNLAVNAGATGNYALGGTGSLSVGGYEQVGYGGAGTFTQTGGSNFIGGVALGIGANSGSTGAYTLENGTLTSANSETVGYEGQGQFNQSGGTNSINAGQAVLWIGQVAGGVGSYSLSNGSLSVGAEYVGGSGTGTFKQTGGTNAIGSGLIVGWNNGSTGTYTLNGTGFLDLSGGGGEIVGYNGSGTFNQSGGTNAMSSDLIVGWNNGSTGTYTLNGTGSLTVAVGSTEFVGYSGTGTFNQAGGTNALAGTLYVGYLGGTGIYSLSGTGLLSVSSNVGNEYVGNIGTGTFNQTGGTNTAVGALNLGNNAGSAGTYNLGGTGSLSIGDEEVGGSGTGTFNQTGGTNAVTGTLYVAANAGSTGAYNLQGGTLTAGAIIVNSGGTLNIAGGNLNATGGMTIAGGTVRLAANVTLGSGLTTSNVILTSLSITGNGVLDVNNNHIIITYGSSDPIATIAGYIASGYNNGNWNGPGIISSAAQTPTNGLLYGLGYADGNDYVVKGLPPGEIEVKYTLLGDANLDGLVNGSDFNILAANFNQSITGWDEGDFNYDGLVNAADFNELAANFNQGVSGASAGDFAALDAFAVANGLSLPTSSVPEPESAVMMVMAASGILRRRRHR